MMDMGGVSPVGPEARINLGKNNKIRAVCLDFNLITRSLEERRKQAELQTQTESRASTGTTTSNIPAPVLPDVSLVNQMANLLNIKLGGVSNSNVPDKVDDDLSLLLGSSPEKENTKPAVNRTVKAPPHMDARDKYAAKLRSKIDGGVAGLQLANAEKDDNAKRGDASLHLAARSLIATKGIDSSKSKSRWLATSGVGKLLSFLSSRSTQIALLPMPSTVTKSISDEDVEQTSKEMSDLAKQLPHVHFDVAIPDGRQRGDVKKSNADAAGDVLNTVSTKLEGIEPIKFLVVSDRDDYLMAARDKGMFTCRVRPANKRRASFTVNYDVDEVSDVQDVLNEINGISFNSALKG